MPTAAFDTLDPGNPLVLNWDFSNFVPIFSDTDPPNPLSTSLGNTQRLFWRSIADSSSLTLTTGGAGPGLGTFSFQPEIGIFEGQGSWVEREVEPQPAIPEPSTILLFGSGLADLAFWRYRKNVKA